MGILVILISSALAVTFINCGIYALKVGINILLEVIKKI